MSSTKELPFLAERDSAPIMRTRERHLFFLQKTIEVSYWLDKISFRTAPPTEDLLFTFWSKILDFRRSISSYLKFGSRYEDSLRFYR